VNGGTSTGRALRDTCFTELDAPNVKSRDGNDYGGGCRPHRPYQTRLNGTASYVVPKIDVLLSTVFQYQPGPEKTATVTYSKDQIVWDTASASRATAPCTVNGVATTGCFVANAVGTVTSSTYQVNVLDFSDRYGEGVWLFDLKVAKVIRFGGRRLNIGADIYNLFNSDAITQYASTYTVDASGRNQSSTNAWDSPTGLVNPRFVRLSVQLTF
jgi:hypothetical protein